MLSINKPFSEVKLNIIINILFEWLQEDGRDSMYEIEPELSSLAISMDNLDQSNVSITYLTSLLSPFATSMDNLDQSNVSFNFLTSLLTSWNISMDNLDQCILQFIF